MNPSESLKEYLKRNAKNGMPPAILLAQFALLTTAVFARKTRFHAEYDSSGIITAFSYSISAVLVSKSRSLSQLRFFSLPYGSVLNAAGNFLCWFLAYFLEKFFEKSLSFLGFAMSIAILFLLLLVIGRPSTDIGIFGFLIGVIAYVARSLFDFKFGFWIVAAFCLLLFVFKCWLDKNWLVMEEEPEQHTAGTSERESNQILKSEIMEAVTVAGFHLFWVYDLFGNNCLRINRSLDSISCTTSSVMVLLCVVIFGFWFTRVSPWLVEVKEWMIFEIKSYFDDNTLVDKFMRNDLSPAEFKKAFRIENLTFQELCDQLRPVIAEGANGIPVNQKVAVCLWHLATGEPLRLVSKRFRLKITTCQELVLEVCSAIEKVLMPRYLRWPDKDNLKTIQEEFKSRSSIPNVVGSMYTSHSHISRARYQKTSSAIPIQGVVDHRGVFTNVCIGWRSHMNGQVLKSSAPCQMASCGLLKNVWIVGNPGYPLMDWVLVSYDANQSLSQNLSQSLLQSRQNFNKSICKIQKIAKDAFVKLKGRWGILKKGMEEQNFEVVLHACSILHNICEERSDEMDQELSVQIEDDEIGPQNSLLSDRDIASLDDIARRLFPPFVVEKGGGSSNIVGPGVPGGPGAGGINIRTVAESIHIGPGELVAGTSIARRRKGAAPGAIIAGPDGSFYFNPDQ